MKLRRIMPLLALLLLVPFLYGQRGCTVGPSTSEMFEQAWSDFDQNYSYFIYKNIDWNAVKEQYAPTFQQEMDAEDFAVQLNEMLQVLHDWHVSVESPKGQAYGYNNTYNINRPEWSVTSPYITDAVDIVDDTITYGVVGNNIAYIDITTLGKSIRDNDVEQIFQKYADADGMIIDIRWNNGGNEENAAMFCSRLTEQSYEYGYTKNRNGPGHDDFDSPVSHVLDPSTGTRFNGPVVGLIGKRCMSSAEWFTLMMKRNPAVTLIGETTRGASAFPKTYKLPNKVSYAISSWMAYTYDDAVIEDNGIDPDIMIPYEESFDDTHDYVLERAIAFIEGGETVTTTVPGSGTTTTMPGGGGGTTTTVAGGGTTTTTVAAGSTTTTATGSGGPVIDSFSVNPTSGGFGKEFEFTCQAHARDGGYIIYYYWDFDDDGSADDFTSYGFYFLSGYFFESGTNTINVLVQDDMGNYSDVASVNITITE